MYWLLAVASALMFLLSFLLARNDPAQEARFRCTDESVLCWQIRSPIGISMT